MKKLAISIIALGICSSAAMADQYSWITWNSWDVNAGTAQGSIVTNQGTVGVSLSGPFFQLLTNYPSWGPSNTYADGTIVNNAPDDHSIVGIAGQGKFTLTFSTAVQDLAMAAWSVGQSGDTVTYENFSQNLSLVAGGNSNEYGGQSITTTANSFSGAEGNGTVLFGSTFNSLSWDVSGNEYWHGFTLGLKTEQAVPEPAPIIVLGAGLVGLILRRRS